ncbi:hypothetical protein [Yoonia sp. R2-816]|uniref:hypothetical protein n=1 Tax=Yoonia sp. R2-816 TaxID=3342638 RepID=UPI00372D4250
MERIDWPVIVWLKIAKFRNKFNLLLAGRMGLAYHRFIGPPLRPGADSSAHRFPHPYLLTPGHRLVVARGLIGSPITASGAT